MCIRSSVVCKEPVRHKLPQTISFIDIDGIVREFDISQYFKVCKKFAGRDTHPPYLCPL